MFKVVGFRKDHKKMATSPLEDDMLRTDVFELYIRLEWLQRTRKTLSEEMWGLELELGGVHSAKGSRLRCGGARIVGVLPTHPPRQLMLELVGGGNGYRIDSYEVRRAPDTRDV